MNDLNLPNSGYQSKVAELLNNKTFSDVQIQVNDGNNPRSWFPAHKLILSMNSQEFAKMFYGNSTPRKVVEIIDFKSEIVYKMLEFLYTNKVHFSDTEVARELYSLSKTFQIHNLQELCVDYISREEVNADNVLHMYECAYKGKYFKCLNFCRQIVSSSTKAVFESSYFVKISLAVLEDILKQDTLTVDSELDIIFAVIKWAFHGLEKCNMTDINNLRKCIFPLLSCIRVLNLKYEEFCDIIEKYPVFTAHESSLITRKLAQPDKSVNLPPHICQIQKPRKYSLNFYKPRNTQELGAVSQKPSILSTDQQSINTARFSHFESSKSMQTSTSNVANVSALKTLDFSLQEAEKLLSTAFKKDVICSVSIDLSKGAIFFHGIELRIHPSHKIGEILKVFLNTANSIMNLSESYTFYEEVEDGIFTLLLNQPMKILEGNRVEIEVTIQDLKLNRCSILKNSVYDLNCLDLAAEIALTSNQINDQEEHFFLISRLIYRLI